MKTTLVLIRHGETETNKANVLCGQTDVNLSKKGEKQASLCAEYLKKFKFDKIYSSDLTRAFRTAQAVAEFQEVEIIKEKGLREIYCGDWECVPPEVLREKFPESYELYFNDFEKSQPDNGESAKDFIARAIDTVTRIAKENQGKTVLVATHGGILRSLDAFVFSDKGWKAFTWYSNVGVSVVEYDDGKWTVLQRNYADYLGELRTDLDVTKV